MVSTAAHRAGPSGASGAADAPGGAAHWRALMEQRAAKLAQYEAFLHERLHADLAVAGALREQRAQELQELRDLQASLRALLQQQQQQQGAASSSGAEPAGTATPGAAQQQEQQQPLPPMKTLVDLGAGVRCQAVVPDPSHVFLSIGLGFHVQCTLPEALQALDRKIELASAALDAATRDVVRVKAHMRLVQEGIAELMGLPPLGADDSE